MKKALILNISHNDLGQIRALKQMGYYVIGTGNNPNLPGRTYVDKYIPTDYSDKDAILKIAKENAIDSVLSCCNDFGVITAAYVAEQMGLPGHDTYQTAITLHHKNLFKSFTATNDIISPISYGFDNAADAKDWARKNYEYPLMVKPIDLTGGKGCSKANSIQECLKAIDGAFDVSRSKKIVIEQYISGTQHACCSFLIDKKVRAICTNDEYSFTNPYKVEVDTYPATGFNDVKNIIIEQIEKMALLLNLKDGIFHVQYIMSNGKPYIIEAMRRILGNLYMVPAMKLTGLDWDYWEARVHCGLGVDGFPMQIRQDGYWAYRCVMGHKNGVIKDVHIPDEFKKYMLDKFELWHKGEIVDDYRNSQLGFYFFQFDGMEQMKDIMINRYNEIFAEYE